MVVHGKSCKNRTKRMVKTLRNVLENTREKKNHNVRVGGGGEWEAIFYIIFWREGLDGKYGNYLADKENYNSFLKLELEAAIFKAQDRKKISTQIHGPQQFDDLKSDKSTNNRRIKNGLKECIQITVRKIKVPFEKGKNTVMAERKQFSLILGQAITDHKSQRSTLICMKGDLSRYAGKKTATGKNDQQPIFQGQCPPSLC